jgi:hypothetical protein
MIVAEAAVARILAQGGAVSSSSVAVSTSASASSTKVPVPVPTGARKPQYPYWDW